MRGSGTRGARSVGACLAAAVALAIAPVVIGVTASSRNVQAEANQLRLPAGDATWRGPLETVDQAWRPVFVGAHEERHVAYEDSTGRTVEAVAVGYPWQEQGRELINEGNSLLGEGGLTSLTSGVVQGNGRSYWELIVADPHGGKSVVWAFYDIGGRGFVTPLFSQLWYGVRSLATPPYSTLLAFRAQCAPSCEAARATLASFLQGMGREPVAIAAPAS